MSKLSNSITPRAIVLFDVDGTLIKTVNSSNHVHREAFSHAFLTEFGINASISEIPHHGMTDQLIIEAVLMKNNIPRDEIWRRMHTMCAHMVEYSKGRSHSVVVLDGVVDLLEALKSRDVVMGLVTGNLEPIAWQKMKAAGLSEYFTFGGFGSDNPDRAEMIRIARNRAYEMYNVQDANILLAHIGDAPSDINAANSAGVRAMAVATGVFSAEALAGLRPAAYKVFSSLSDTDEVIRMLDL